MAFFDPFADSTKQAYDDISFESSTLQSAEAAYKLSKMGTATALLDFQDNSGKQDSTEMVDPVRLNQLYPGLEKPFTRATPIGVANAIAERTRERQAFQRIIQEGPNNAFQTMLNFSAQMAPHAIDKWEFSAGVAGSAVFAMAMGPMAITAGLGTLAARAFIGNVAGNLLVEPLMVYGMHEAQEQYTAEDSFTSVVGGALLGTTLHVGGVGGKAVYKNFKSADGSFGKRLQTAISQMVTGKRVNVDVETKGFKGNGDAIEHTSSSREVFDTPLIPDDAFTPPSLPRHLTAKSPPPIPVDRIPGIPHSERLPGTPNVATAAFEGGRMVTGGILEGTEVLYAGRREASSLIKSKGQLAEFDVSDLRLVDGTAPKSELSRELRLLVEDIASDLGSGGKKNMSLQEALDSAPNIMREAHTNEIRRVLTDLGYDGVISKQNVDGVETTAMNVFRLDESKMTNSRTFTPSSEMVPNAKQTEMRSSLLSPENDQYYDSKTRTAYENSPDGFVEQRNVEVAEVPELNRELLSPVGKKLADQADEFKANMEQTQKALKSAYGCE